MHNAVCAHLTLAIANGGKHNLLFNDDIIYYYISGCGPQFLRGVACVPKHSLKKLAPTCMSLDSSFL